MQSKHPNIDLVASINTADMSLSADLFHPDVVWHFSNPSAPELMGSYKGMAGIDEFFQKVRKRGEGSFLIQPRGAWAVGDELVVVQSCNRLGKGIEAIEFDVVLVWRIIDQKVWEVWDIPASQSRSVGP